MDFIIKKDDRQTEEQKLHSKKMKDFSEREFPKRIVMKCLRCGMEYSLPPHLKNRFKHCNGPTCTGRLVRK